MIDGVNVRMYQAGFGDCFLLSFRDEHETKHILIDCGSITEGKTQVSKVVSSVISASTEAGQPPRLELVVGTHRHRDHVGGFADPAWAKVEVGEVWMPWTEDPRDADATMIRNRQSSLALGLARSIAAARSADDDDEPLSVEAAPGPGETARASRDRALRAMALNAGESGEKITVRGGWRGNHHRMRRPYV
jgi:glyoxylase-like metal-dependent hydrolase (beta-lactamase superfamily II)